MGIELTQWTLVKPGRLGAPRSVAPDTVWLKAPSGEMELLPLAGLSPEVRGLVGELASGSKVPKSMLGEILAARAGGDAPFARVPARPWTFHHLDRADGLYVYLSPPPERGARPLAFALAQLQPELRRRLELTSPGEAVAEEVITALHGETAAPALTDPSFRFGDRTPRR
jgi:hypothetical protein